MYSVILRFFVTVVLVYLGSAVLGIYLSWEYALPFLLLHTNAIIAYVLMLLLAYVLYLGILYFVLGIVALGIGLVLWNKS